MTTPQTQLFLEGPVLKVLWKFATPNLIAVLFINSATMADAFFVGTLGTISLASLALVFPLQTLMIMQAGGAMGGGVTSAISRALGRNALEEVNTLVWHSIVMSAFVCCLYTVVFGLFANYIFAIFTNDSDVISGAVGYSRIFFGLSIAVWSFYICSSILRALGRIDAFAKATISSVILQIILSGILTIGLGAFTGFGVAGPAIAAIICHMTASLYMGYVLLTQTSIMIRPQKIKLAPMVDILKVSALSLVNSFSIAITVLIVTGFISRYGTAAIAGYGLGNRLELMLIPISFGLGGVLNAAVGINFGAKQYARARKIAWSGALIVFLFIAIIGITISIFPGIWLNFFTSDSETYKYGAVYLGIAAPFFCLFGGGQTLFFASQGTGKMLLPVAIGILRMLVVLVIGIFTIIISDYDIVISMLSAGFVISSWGINAIFAGIAVGFAVVGIGLSLNMFTKNWNPND